MKRTRTTLLSKDQARSQNNKQLENILNKIMLYYQIFIILSNIHYSINYMLYCQILIVLPNDDYIINISLYYTLYVMTHIEYIIKYNLKPLNII